MVTGRGMGRLLAAVAVVVATACGEDEVAEFGRAVAEESTVTVYWYPTEAAASTESLARARRDTSWWSAPTVDTILRTDTLLSLPNDRGVYRPPWSSYEIPESWSDLSDLVISTDMVPLDLTAEMSLPLGGDVEGPSVIYAQILFDRSPFSPGAIDGRWGSNTERAVFWYQRARGIAPTGQLDSATLARLYEEAGAPRGLLTRYEVRRGDVGADLAPLPDDVYERDSLACLCYESAAERLSERAHTTVELLSQLNGGDDLDGLAPGDTIIMPFAGELVPGSRSEIEAAAPGADSAGARRPDVPDSSPAGPRPGSRASPPSEPRPGEIAALVISDRGRYLHALDVNGDLLYHVPATLGSEYHPSPRRTLEVVSITRSPWFHYQPSLLAGVDDSLPDTRLPPGPNSPVGVVWIQLSDDHYGIHGTDEPATIGHAQSSGCIRLTNWDVGFLADRLRPGVPVRFVDLEDEGGGPPGPAFE